MTTESRLMTGEELYLHGPAEPCELVEGRIVPMTPPGGEHGTVMFNLGALLVGFVRSHRIGRVLGGDTGMYTRRFPDTVRGPDVAVLSYARWPARVPIGYLTVAPEVVVEIVSPSNTSAEIDDKLAEYFSAGVDQAWVVTPAFRRLTVYRSRDDSTVYRESEIFRADGVLEGFETPVAALFED